MSTAATWWTIDVRADADVSELHGVYVPYWTFDADVTSRWTADAGYYYYVTESYTTTENGITSCVITL